MAFSSRVVGYFLNEPVAREHAQFVFQLGGICDKNKNKNRIKNKIRTGPGAV